MSKLNCSKNLRGQLAYVERCFAQNKTVSAERANQYFFENSVELVKNRQQQRLLLKPKFFENFDNNVKRVLEGKSKLLRWVADKLPILREIEKFRTKINDCRKNTLRIYKLDEVSVSSISCKWSTLEKNLKAESLTDSKIRLMDSQMEELLGKMERAFE